MAGTKKQKIDISKAIVEAIYSKDPPGRFLKKCSKSGQWKELSKRDAADRAAQAMAYVINGKSLKEKRRRRRLNLPPPSLPHNEDGPGRKPSHSADRPTHLGQNTEGNHSSSATNYELAAGRVGAAGTWNSVQSATNLFRMPGESNLQQQLLLQQLQLQQANTPNTTILPTSAGDSIIQSVHQNSFAQPQQLFQTLQGQQQQQQQHRQQLLRQLQCTSGPPNNPLGQLLQPQAALQPALNEGMTHHVLDHAQHQQLLLHRLLNQQNEHSSSSLPMPTPTSAPFLPPSHPATNIFVQNVQQQSNAPLSFGDVLRNNNMSYQPNSKAGISDAPQPHQQLPFRQQQLQPLQPAVQADPINRNFQPLPSLNHAGMTSSTNAAAAQSTWQAENDDVEQRRTR